MSKFSIIYFVKEDDTECTVLFSDDKLILYGEDDGESDCIDMDSYIGGCYAFCDESEKFEVTDKLEAPLWDGIDFDRVLIHELLSQLQEEEAYKQLPLKDRI